MERDRPRTIAFLIRGDESYGVRQGTLSLLKGLSGRGWNTPVVALREGETADACRAMGCQVRWTRVDLPPRPGGATWRKAAHFVAYQPAIGRVSASVAGLLRPARPDAIHVRWPDLVTVAGRAARSLGVPCFWHLPTVIRDDKRFGVSLPALFYQWQCRRYGVVPLANSSAVAATLGNVWVKPLVLHLGVDAERFDPARVEPVSRQELGVPPEATALAMFGRVIPGKGQDRVLEAMLSMHDVALPLHLVVMGGPTSGPQADRLRRIAAQHHAQARLHMAGHVGAPERYYPAVDVAVSAFLGIEGFGLSVVEAMMMAKPVLAHASGGPAETVIDGVTGWHVPDASVGSLVKGLRRALADRPRWPKMGAQARQHAVRNYSTEAFCSRYVDIVGRCVPARER